MGGNERGRTKRRTTKELQVLDPLGSPHLDERLIGGNVDLDLLSLLPQKYAIFAGGIQSGGKVFMVNNGGRERGKRAALDGEPLGKKAP